MLEAVLVGAIFSLAAAFIIPIGEKYLTRKLEYATRDEMLKIRDAALRFYEDVGRFPATLAELASEPGGTTGWTGPYLTVDFSNESTTENDFRYDAWRHAYTLVEAGAYERLLRSTGQNGTSESGSGDDLELHIHAAPILRKIEARRLDTLNAAIGAYNATYLPAQPLSSDLGAAISRLQQLGFLPSDAQSTSELSTDVWGQPWVMRGSPLAALGSLGAGDQRRVLDRRRGLSGGDAGSEGSGTDQGAAAITMATTSTA
ncbi:MAG: type II secretion system protein GspG [Planctomycetota bacterium]